MHTGYGKCDCGMCKLESMFEAMYNETHCSRVLLAERKGV